MRRRPRRRRTLAEPVLRAAWGGSRANSPLVGKNRGARRSQGHHGDPSGEHDGADRHHPGLGRDRRRDALPEKDSSGRAHRAWIDRPGRRYPALLAADAGAVSTHDVAERHSVSRRSNAHRRSCIQADRRDFYPRGTTGGRLARPGVRNTGPRTLPDQPCSALSRPAWVEGRPAQVPYRTRSARSEQLVRDSSFVFPGACKLSSTSSAGPRGHNAEGAAWAGASRQWRPNQLPHAVPEMAESR
jgi:hypothetical protein